MKATGIVARRRRRREEGQTLVEFALVLPVLLLVLLAILKFGLMFNHYLTLTDAVRAGARQLALGRGSATNPCTAAEQQAANSAGSLNLVVGGADSSFQPAESFTGSETCLNSASAWIQGDQAEF